MYFTLYSSHYVKHWYVYIYILAYEVTICYTNIYPSSPINRSLYYLQASAHLCIIIIIIIVWLLISNKDFAQFFIKTNALTAVIYVQLTKQWKVLFNLFIILKTTIIVLAVVKMKVLRYNVDNYFSLGKCLYISQYSRLLNSSLQLPTLLKLSLGLTVLDYTCTGWSMACLVLDYNRLRL